MRTRAWNLIVIPPRNSEEGLEQFHFSYKTVMVLVLAFVVSFLMTVLLLLTHPQPRVNESDRRRLEGENRLLKLGNDNLLFKIHQLDNQLNQIEERSKLVETLMVDTE
jgi:hypothetical protein